MRTILAALAVLAGLAVHVPQAAAQSAPPAGQSIAARVAAAEAADAAARGNMPAAAPVRAAQPLPSNDFVLPVPVVPIYAGDLITDSVLVDRVFSAAPNDRVAVATSREQLLGKVARRSLAANTPIAINAFADPKVVSRGTLAPVLLQEGGLVISGFAMPLENGSVGNLVRLKNIESGLTIAGTVQADGSVRVSAQ